MVGSARKGAGHTLFLAGLFAALAAGFSQPARAEKEVAACIPIKTAAQLQAIKNNLAGTYCLMNDIDLSSIVNFEPIGVTVQFTGRLYGNGHVIRNLKIDNTTSGYAGLFGVVAAGIVQDVGLINVNVSSSKASYVGALAGALVSGKIQRVYSTGTVKCVQDLEDCVNGGLIGLVQQAKIYDAWSSAAVSGGYAAAGLIGASAGDTTVENSYATGDATCSGSECVAAAGFSAQASHSDVVADSYATGTVTCLTEKCVAGGFVAFFFDATAANIYATGAVTGGTAAEVGGLIGEHDGVISSCFATGPVSGGSGASVGGLIGDVTGTSTVTNCYWDKNTTGQMSSAGGLGTGRTTAQLRAALQTGFTTGAWGINKTLSYPFLNSDGFSSNLATLVLANKVYTALPVVQSDKSQYIGNPVHAGEASLAAVYTMAARAIGQTLNVAQLDNAKIDKYFWNDATQTASFKGPVTTHAVLGAMTNIPAGAKLTGANVIGALNGQNWVVLRGTYKKANGQTATHHMLGTLYTRKGVGVVFVIANDPFTGQQIAISPATKKVVMPANFPLTGFTVNGYATISNIH